MIDITVLCVGRMKEKYYIDAAAEYVKRLSPYCRLTVTELQEERLPQSPSKAQTEAALLKEAAAIRSRLQPGTALAALCVEGKQYSSEELAELIDDFANGPAKRLVFLIGSSNGLDESLKKEAWAKISMSRMTFPHHLARVMLLEQIYRAFTIIYGGKYHK